MHKSNNTNATQKQHDKIINKILVDSFIHKTLSTIKNEHQKLLCSFNSHSY